jgi:hypothetical protein
MSAPQQRPRHRRADKPCRPGHQGRRQAHECARKAVFIRVSLAHLMPEPKMLAAAIRYALIYYKPRSYLNL